MFDPNKTVVLIKGGLLEPRQTWAGYQGENRDWKETAALLTGPLIIASVVLTALFAWVFSSHYMIMRGPGGLGGLLLGLLFAVIGIALASLIFSYLAGMFKGEPDFSRGLAALSLAAIPAYVGNVLGTLPWIGWLLALGLGILSLVYLYQIIPLYLKVPDAKRVPHFALSLVCTLVTAVVLASVLGVGSMSGYRSPMMGGSMQGGDAAAPPMFGEMGRQAQIMEQAEADRYDPPADGRISAAQMERYLDVMNKSADFSREQTTTLRQLEKKQGDRGDISLGDLGKFTGSLMGAMTAEMQVIKTGGGNWAEHMWVKQQLQIARIQKDISDEVRHNYALYKKYAERLNRVGR
jgi:hypothetical protein